MRILHLSTNYQPVSRSIRHGGVERIVYHLALSQVKQKHEVHVLGMKGTEVLGATNIDIYPTSIQEVRSKEKEQYNQLMKHSCQQIYQYILKNSFDVVHDHYGYFITSPYFSQLVSENNQTRFICSIYGLPENPYYKEIYTGIGEQVSNYPNRMKVICVSNDHKELWSKYLPVSGYVYNGVNISDFAYSEQKASYFLSFASLVKEKGHDRCISWAKTNNKPLIVVGKSDPAVTSPEFLQMVRENTYNADHLITNDSLESENQLEQALQNHQILYLTSVDEELKIRLMSQACALFMLVRWREPFAVTVLESLASGTPVIASNIGSLREAIINGVTGFLVNNDLEVEEAVNQISLIRPDLCRNAVESMFSVDRMHTEYMKEYVSFD